jgi:XapX domain-containing protein
MKTELLSLMIGFGVGAGFAALHLPVPAPMTLSGILGIFGMWLGMMFAMWLGRNL